MKKKIAAILIACMIGGTFIAGCAKNETQNRSKSAAAKTAEHNYATEAYEDYGDLEMDYAGVEADDYYDSFETTVAMDYDDEMYNAPDDGSGQTPGAPDTKTDVSKEMLVFRCTMAIDTLEFEQSLAALNAKIAEYHGFIERQTQTDGTSSGGRYIIEEEDKDYYYTATIRIPSEYYESFVSATEGIGTLRSKNSSVDNVATRYGTLKNDLEIYEAEYDRYMKQYNETEDESIALQIQRELRNLAITISDIKTEMSMLESDVAYSYVTVTIHKVSQKEIEKEEEEVQEEDSFSTRLSKTAKQSWDSFVGFLEGIVLSLVAAWWGIAIALIIFLFIFFMIRHSMKKARKQAEAQRAAAEARHAEQMKAYQEAQAAQQKRAEQRAEAEQKAAQAADQKAAQTSAQTTELKADQKPELAADQKPEDPSAKAPADAKSDE